MVFLTQKRQVGFQPPGQYLPKSGGCIATSRTGRPCQIPRATKLMPYCKPCDLANLMVLVVFSPNFCCSKKKAKKYGKLYWLQPWACQTIFYVQVCIQNQGMMKGDPSLKAVKHPKFGKILVATRNLSQRLLCGMVGQALSEETSTFQANGMGLGNKQRYGGCYTVQGISTEVLRMSRQDSDHNLQLAASTSHLLIERFGWQVPASCLPLILHPIVLLPQTSF